MANIDFVGNLAADPDIHYTQNADPVCTLRVGHTPRKKDRNGQYVDHGVTQWYTVETWGKVAETLANNLRKGARVHVSGTLVHETWQTQQGEERTTHMVKYPVVTVPVEDNTAYSGAVRPAGGFSAPQGSQDPAGNLAGVMRASSAPQHDPWAVPADDNPPF